jgi:hypothetical protein
MKGVIHSSDETVLEVLVLYFKVALGPYATTPDLFTVTVAVPSSERTPLIVAPVAFLTPPPESVRFS